MKEALVCGGEVPRGLFDAFILHGVGIVRGISVPGLLLHASEHSLGERGLGIANLVYDSEKVHVITDN